MARFRGKYLDCEAGSRQKSDQVAPGVRTSEPHIFGDILSGRFEGKVALVTGAAKGIGESAVDAFASDGAQVAMCDVDEAGLSEQQRGQNEKGNLVSAHKIDVRDSASVESVVNEVAGKYGHIDILVNLAGVVRYGELPEFSVDDWDFVVGINLRGTFLTCKYVIPFMQQQGSGVIINTSSVQAFASQATTAAYSASKGGVASLTQALALDHFKDGIRVNAIAPGVIRTPMLFSAAQNFAPDDPEGAITEWGSLQPIGRPIEPKEVAQVIAFLASDNASCVSGAVYRCDGGLLSKLAI
jgi:NAD(P)-dependent dehydrogenase (short-subunit alcohol dehydrogenase family)